MVHTQLICVHEEAGNTDNDCSNCNRVYKDGKGLGCFALHVGSGFMKCVFI